MSSKFVRIEVKNDLRIVYFRADGSSAMFLGGKKAWRLNNPGNIGYGNGKLVRTLGAIGRLHATAVFPDYETGRRAIFEVLKRPDYQERTLSNAIKAWAPSEDQNDPIAYSEQVHVWTGLDMERRVKDLNESELTSFVNAIEKKEGGGEGKIIEVPKHGFTKKKQITQVTKNKKGTIVSYCIEDIGWVSKAQGIELTACGLVDAVIATSSAGNAFLRTRPGVEIVNLEDLG
jgi:hypothetical protein